jgi:hypothetical protein
MPLKKGKSPVVPGASARYFLIDYRVCRLRRSHGHHVNKTHCLDGTRSPSPAADLGKISLRNHADLQLVKLLAIGLLATDGLAAPQATLAYVDA